MFVIAVETMKVNELITELSILCSDLHMDGWHNGADLVTESINAIQFLARKEATLEALVSYFNALAESPTNETKVDILLALESIIGV